MFAILYKAGLIPSFAEFAGPGVDLDIGLLPNGKTSHKVILNDKSVSSLPEVQNCILVRSIQQQVLFDTTTDLRKEKKSLFACSVCRKSTPLHSRARKVFTKHAFPYLLLQLVSHASAQELIYRIKTLTYPGVWRSEFHVRCLWIRFVSQGVVCV
jgi:hypothetical protein